MRVIFVFCRGPWKAKKEFWGIKKESQKTKQELNKVLRQGASITLAKDLQVGAKGKIETESKNAHGLRGSSAKSLPVKDAAEPAAAAKSPPSTASELPPQTPGVDGLKDALGKRLREMLDLFKKWDVDLNGTIDKAEFRKAVNSLGLEYEAGIVDTVFEGYDADGSGEMEYHEFVQYSLRDSLKRYSVWAPVPPVLCALVGRIGGP